LVVRCSLKIDVDTLEGYLTGVPRLAELLGSLGIRATFCVAMGPDCSGRAIRRIVTRRGFLAKMLRTRAPSMYGPRTLLYGTLLPAPQIVATRPQVLHDLLAARHEVIPHGWNHVDWHDFLPRWSLERTERELRRACEAFEQYAGRPCHAFAAPGWQATARSLLVEAQLGLRYSADTRGWCPFFPLADGTPLAVVQIPTTLPTLDEMIGLPELRGTDLLEQMLSLVHSPASDGEDGSPPDELVHVFTCHAEVEGMAWRDWFEGFLRALQSEGVEFATLDELAARTVAAGNVPTGRVVAGTLPGRAGTVSCQAPAG
jgi:undecaprenyl phosphate-alpha-L-ara4FN deformylase